MARCSSSLRQSALLSGAALPASLYSVEGNKAAVTGAGKSVPMHKPDIAHEYCNKLTCQYVAGEVCSPCWLGASTECGNDPTAQCLVSKSELAGRHSAFQASTRVLPWTGNEEKRWRRCEQVMGRVLITDCKQRAFWEGSGCGPPHGLWCSDSVHNFDGLS